MPSKEAIQLTRQLDSRRGGAIIPRSLDLVHNHDFDLAKPLDDSPASRRMIVILHKQEAIK